MRIEQGDQRRPNNHQHQVRNGQGESQKKRLRMMPALVKFPDRGLAVADFYGFEKQVAGSHRADHHDRDDAHRQHHTRRVENRSVSPEHQRRIHRLGAHRANANQKRRAKSPAQRLVDDGEVDRAHGHGDDKPGDETSQNRLKVVFHGVVVHPSIESSSSSSDSSDSISRRQRLLTQGRTRPYNKYATNNAASVTSNSETNNSPITAAAANAATDRAGVQSMYLNVGYRTLLTIRIDSRTINPARA